MQLALREVTADLRRRASDPRLIAIWAGVSLVSVIAGPFQTAEWPALVRLAYWPPAILVAMILSTTLIGGAYDQPHLARLPRLARGLVGAALFSLIYAGLLAGAGALAFGGPEGYPGFLLMLFYVAPVALAVTVVVHLVIARATPQAEASPADTAPFLRRLKPALGRNLVRLAMQDHYVEAITEKGSQLILMRFSDALEEVAGLPGRQIHRSHWVAEAGVADIRREGGRWVVRTSDGETLPVSRTYLPALRESGLLRRFA